MITLKEENGKIGITSPYNTKFVSDLKKSISGAKWNGSLWVVPSEAKQVVLDLLKEHYGYSSDAKYVTVKIKAKKYLSQLQSSISFAGVPIARATGRDSGARVCDDVFKISGEITSSGSVKNWHTSIEEGSEFQLKVPENIAISTEDWDCEILQELKIDIEALKIEKEKLLKRLAFIENILKEIE